MTREYLRALTTVHFSQYGEEECSLLDQLLGRRFDLRVELSDWNMSATRQRKAAMRLTAVLAELFGIPSKDIDGINIRAGDKGDLRSHHGLFPSKRRFCWKGMFRSTPKR